MGRRKWEEGSRRGGKIMKEEKKIGGDEEKGREEYEVKREEKEKGMMRGGIEGDRVKRRWGREDVGSGDG